MKTVAFYDTKPYDKIWFDKLQASYGVNFKYIEDRLSRDTAALADGCKAVVAFVNDKIDAPTIDILGSLGVEAIAMRCAGYNNVDMAHAKGKLRVFRVPAYSPHAVAEHAMSLLMCLNRKLHRAYNRVRENNFSLKGLTGFDLYGKTVGVVGTGKIGQVFIDICLGLGMKVLAFDPYPVQKSGVEYVSFEDLCRQADVISLHCPLMQENHHLINRNTLAMMKDGVVLINTSRGGLIDTVALLDAVNSGKVSAVGLDVYENEANIFFEDLSEEVLQDETLKLLLAHPNILVTSHQAFLTQEALQAIAEVTLQNLADFFTGRATDTEVL